MKFYSVVNACRYYAEDRPDKICIIDESGRHSYKEVWTNVCRILDWFHRKNINKGAYIVVECMQNAFYLEIALACQLGGLIFIPVEKASKEERISDICQETNADIFLYDGSYNNNVCKNIVSLKYLYTEAILSDFYLDDYWADKLMTDVSEDDVATILYTTGTTGKPKGIMLTNRNFIALTENISFGTEMKEDNVELIPLPISHAHGLYTSYTGIVNGSSVVLMDGVLQIADVFSAIEKYHVNALDLSPSAARILLKLGKDELEKYAGQISYIEIGTAFLDEDTKMVLCEKFPDTRLYNFYGLTEAGRVCILNFNKKRKAKACIGKPVPNASILIIDDNGEPIKSSNQNIGLIAVAGKMLMKGYFNSDDNPVHNGYLRTSDVGYIDEEGYIFVLGRADDVINCNGIKIAPEEIETPVLRYSGVVDCACVPCADKISGFVPKLFIETDDSFDMKGFRAHLAKLVEQNRLPKQIEIIDKIPRTFNGKLQRKKLRE